MVYVVLYYDSDTSLLLTQRVLRGAKTTGGVFHNIATSFIVSCSRSTKGFEITCDDYLVRQDYHGFATGFLTLNQVETSLIVTVCVLEGVHASIGIQVQKSATDVSIQLHICDLIQCANMVIHTYPLGRLKRRSR